MAYAPGVSAPSQVGLSPEFVLDTLSHIIRSGKALSFDIAETNPAYDQDNKTVSLAAKMIESIVYEIKELISN